jgi:hypothetical protein
LLPAPRRAVGPDLSALCVGAAGSIAQVESASLALVRRSVVVSGATATPALLSSDEATAWQRIVAAFA